MGQLAQAGPRRFAINCLGLPLPACCTLQVTRQKLPNDWHKRVQAIQAKITEATKELPPELLASLPGGPEAGIDYFKAVLIRDKLAETGERTLFGGLSGKAGVWDQVVKAYEKGGECGQRLAAAAAAAAGALSHGVRCARAGSATQPAAAGHVQDGHQVVQICNRSAPRARFWSYQPPAFLAPCSHTATLCLPLTPPPKPPGVYLGEAAQHLVQYVDYEIPYLRKQQSKNAQMISDAERKQADYIKGAAACAANFQQVIACMQHELKILCVIC